jgi:uncharacterized RDD family membrane protein YckC
MVRVIRPVSQSEIEAHDRLVRNQESAQDVETNERAAARLYWTFFASLFVAGLAYFPLQECSRWQATLGKRIFRLRVYDAEKRRLSTAGALRRYLAKCFSLLTLGLGFAYARLDPSRQAIHDLAAGTVVLKI